MHVVATAGHVDHGKSTLVRALTGQDPDRLEDERRRGLSIELGYCWTDLPPHGEVAFVDVPGHERFIATALSGLGPSPAVMFVVAADDPWMPQAAEHLAALDALGVRHGMVVVTRCDLADPAPALARARAEVDRTSLAGAPAVAVSGRTGAGLDALRSTLAGVLAAVPTPAPDADVRLWVDRRFHVKGVGTVVTGTLVSGSVAVGDVLEVEGQQVRVRGLEALGSPREVVRATARVAVDLGGRAPSALGRGSALLTPEAFLHGATLDVAVTGPEPVPGRPVLHCGTAQVGVRSRHLGGDMWRLTLERTLPVRVGDRALLRDPGNRRSWGVEVLDPLPPPLRRRGAAAARARTLATGDRSIAGELARRGVVRRSEMRRLGVPPEPRPSDSVVAGDWLLDADRARTLRPRLVALVEEAEASGADGLAPAAAARALGLPDPALVEPLLEARLVTDGGRIRTGRPPALPAGTGAALAALREDLAENPFAAPEAGRLEELGLDAARVAALHRAGAVLRVAPGIVLLPDAAARAVDRLRALPQPFTAGEARRALDTTRRVVLPLLGHLDASGGTVRLPDDRRRVTRSGRPR